MTELIGNPGFAAPRNAKRRSRRRALAIELIATGALTLSLIAAATAVSMGNRLLAHNASLPPSALHMPQRGLAHHADEKPPTPARP